MLHFTLKLVTNFFASRNRAPAKSVLALFFLSLLLASIFLDDTQCALCYSDNRFFIEVRDRFAFRLFALKATFIKSLNPILCKQNDFAIT